MTRRVLVVAPHADDEVLGCTGAITHHVQRGDEVYVLIVSDRKISGRQDDEYTQKTRATAESVARKLGVRKVLYGGLNDLELDHMQTTVISIIEHAVNEVKPQVGYGPNNTDTDQDHRAVANACRVAFRFIDWHFAYEIPGPSRGFDPTYYIDLSGLVEKKIELMGMYEGEMREFPIPRSPEGIRALARWRGTESGTMAAEAFKLIKGVIRL